MHQPVDQGRGQGVVHVKEFAPFPEGSIRGDHDRSHFITGGDNLEQQIGPMLVDGRIAQLIEKVTERVVVTLTGFANHSMIVRSGRGQRQKPKRIAAECNDFNECGAEGMAEFSQPIADGGTSKGVAI